MEVDRGCFEHLWNGKPFISNVQEALPDWYVITVDAEDQQNL
jgi:hypothetical protein